MATSSFPVDPPVSPKTPPCWRLIVGITQINDQQQFNYLLRSARMDSDVPLASVVCHNISYTFSHYEAFQLSLAPRRYTHCKLCSSFFALAFGPSLTTLLPLSLRLLLMMVSSPTSSDFIRCSKAKSLSGACSFSTRSRNGTVLTGYFGCVSFALRERVRRFSLLS